MQKNPYLGKPNSKAKLVRGSITHLFRKKEDQTKKWFITLSGRSILLRKKGGGFIVFEGLDGSGQSTQAELLRDFLMKRGCQVVLTKEPTLDSQAGKKIRKILDKKEKISPRKLQELFIEDCREHLKNLITPALKKGKIVISDRYFFSTFAYGGADGLDLGWLIKMNEDFLLPDLTFILKVSPKVCLERIKKRNKRRTLFEKKEKLEKAWQIFQILPQSISKIFSRGLPKPSPLTKGLGIYLIEGEKSIKQIFCQVRNLLVSQFLV